LTIKKPVTAVAACKTHVVTYTMYFIQNNTKLCKKSLLQFS